MVDFALAPGRAALINVDLQNFFVERASDGLAVVERVNRLAASAREAGMMVIHTRHVLRPDGSNMGVLREFGAEDQGRTTERSKQVGGPSPSPRRGSTRPRS
jgi:ureidoacrylate peracid hydrolase